MIGYAVRRGGFALATVLVSAVGVFSLQRLIPGGPARALAGLNASPQALQSINARLGLDHPFVVQFWDWLSSAVQGDLGRSYQTQQPVTTIIDQHFVPTLELVGFSLAVSLVLGGLIGTWSALRADRPDGKVIFFSTGLGLSVPDFWVGTLAAGVFGLTLHWVPAVGYVSLSSSIGGNLQSVVLPVLVISLASSALVARQLRSGLVGVLSAPHLRTARALGVPRAAMFRQDMLRLAAGPVVTIVPLLFAGLVGSAVVVENVFNIPGLGTAIIQAVNNRDYPTLQGITLLLCVAVIALNILADLVGGALDPRRRAGAR
jgi:peptide/nickel transport system permease protein